MRHCFDIPIRGLTPLSLLILLAGCGGEEAGGPQLGPVVTITSAGGSAPTVAINPADGRAYVTWVGGQAEAYNVYLASAGPDESFGQAVQVNDLPGDGSPHDQAPPQVAVGAGGEVYLLWQNNTPVEGRRFPASDLRFSASVDGGRTFRPAISVNNDAGHLPSSHTFHNMLVAPDGSLVISWIDSRDQDMAASAGHQHGSGMATIPADTTSDIRFVHSTDGGLTFSPEVLIDENPCPCCRTALAVGPDGSVYVAWRKIFAGDVRDIVVARGDLKDLSFAAPVKVNDDDWVFAGCPHAGAGLVVDGTGRLHVGWYTGREDRQGLWYASSADGGQTFSEPEPVLTGDFVPPSLIALSMVDGEVVISWDDRTTETSTVRVARVDARGIPRVVEAAPTPGRTPSLAGSGSTGFAAWVQDGAIMGRWAN